MAAAAAAAEGSPADGSRRPPPPPATEGESSVADILSRLAAAVGTAEDIILVPEDEACRRKPESLVRQYVLISGRDVGHVTAFRRTRNPLFKDSPHEVRLATSSDGSSSSMVLRRRKMGGWNGGRPFAILRPPPRPPAVTPRAEGARRDDTTTAHLSPSSSSLSSTRSVPQQGSQEQRQPPTSSPSSNFSGESDFFFKPEHPATLDDSTLIRTAKMRPLLTSSTFGTASA